MTLREKPGKLLVTHSWDQPGAGGTLTEKLGKLLVTHSWDQPRAGATPWAPGQEGTEEGMGVAGPGWGLSLWSPGA